MKRFFSSSILFLLLPFSFPLFEKFLHETNSELGVRFSFAKRQLGFCYADWEFATRVGYLPVQQAAHEAASSMPIAASIPLSDRYPSESAPM